MSLLAFVDRLLVFDKGRLVADGPRDKVLAMLQSGKRRRRRRRRAAEPIHATCCRQ